MPDVAEQAQHRLRYGPWLAGSFIVIAPLIIARFVVEVAGMPHQLSRFTWRRWLRCAGLV